MRKKIIKYKKYIWVSILIFIFLFVGIITIIECKLGISPCYAAEQPIGKTNINLEKGVEPGIVDYLANFIYTIYNYLTKVIIQLFEQTIFKDSPTLANYYAQVASFLASLTAIFIILEMLNISRKAVKFLLLLGWLLFIASIVIRTIL